ncbi:hypothetical protein O9992_00925 [Vibrio lentus]|nr:hypothetical protein [Vibrio lentus]
MPIVTLCSSYVLIHISNFEGLACCAAPRQRYRYITIRLVYLILCVHYDLICFTKIDTEKSEFITNIRRHFIEIFPVAANVTMLSIAPMIYQLLLATQHQCLRSDYLGDAMDTCRHSIYYRLGSLFRDYDQPSDRF